MMLGMTEVSVVPENGTVGASDALMIFGMTEVSGTLGTSGTTVTSFASGPVEEDELVVVDGGGMVVQEEQSLSH